LVEEEHTRTGLDGGEEGGFEVGAVGRGEIYDARGGGLLGGGGENEGGEENGLDRCGTKEIHADLRGNSLQVSVISLKF